jgi:quercetin dioxygenase-like cupin family protein
MPDWTRKNFRDLRDVSPPDAQVQWRFARDALGSPELGVSRFTYDPGARMPWGHRHRVQEEVYVVVAGSGRAKLDDEVVELSTWDVLRVAPAVVRSFEACPEGRDVICIGGRKPKEGDTERFDDFWVLLPRHPWSRKPRSWPAAPGALGRGPMSFRRGSGRYSHDDDAHTRDRRGRHRL